MLKLIEQLIKDGVDLNKQDDQGQTLLMKAAEQGHFPAAIKLLEGGADPFLTDQKGQTALMKAILSSQEKICSLLTGAMQGRIGQKDENGESAIDMAKRLNLDIADLLESCFNDMPSEEELLQDVQKIIAENPYFNGIDEEGNSYLSHMIHYKYNQIAKFLMDQKGIDLNHESSFGLTPLMYAVLDENDEMLQVLIEKGADLFVETKLGHTALSLAKLVGARKEVIDQLMKAEENAFLILKQQEKETIAKESLDPSEHHLLLKELLSRPDAAEKNYNIKNQYDISPLMYAVLLAKYEAALWFIDKGADVNLRGVMGETALLTATRTMDPKMAKLLIDYGADVTVENEDGDTPLLLATQMMNITLIKLFIEAGADIHKKNQNGLSALDFVVRREDYEVAAFMKELQEEVERKNSLEEIQKSLERDEYLLKAIETGNKKAILKALEKGGDINLIDDQGNGILFICICKNKVGAFQTLVEQGAPINQKNNKNQTVLDFMADAKVPKRALNRYLQILAENEFDFSLITPQTRAWLQSITLTRITSKKNKKSNNQIQKEERE